jgi:uncharacterized RDD family membrane protein YckC
MEPNPYQSPQEENAHRGCAAHSLNYANFWQRFAAIWIDGAVIFFPVMFAEMRPASLPKVVAILLVVPISGAYCAYTNFCHGRFGKTVGKHVMGIRVVQLTGERIGWREAWLRSSVDVVFSTVQAIGSFIALAAISDADYFGVDWMQRVQNLQNLKPAWIGWTMTASEIWFWSEVVVMLFNEKRRSLHDFIAGTVVIAEQKGPATPVTERRAIPDCDVVRATAIGANNACFATS